MRIACVAYLHGFGGAERQIITLANQMAERGHEVNLIIVAEDKICYDIDSRVKIHSLVKLESRHLLPRIVYRRKLLVSILKELHCNVVINFNFQSAYFLAMTNKEKVGKIVYSERGDPGDKEYRGILGMIRKCTLHRIDGFVFQSCGARNFFKEEYVEKNSIIIPNACFIGKKVSMTPSREKRIVTVGRLSQQKNQKLLIEAFSKITKKYPDFMLELYGEGELKEELIDYVKKRGLTSRVCFKGAVQDIRRRIENASLFVLSSDYEGIPNALIEAMALGLPVISTDCRPGGARTLITHGVDGFITPIKDSYELSKAIEFMLSNPKKAETMGRYATEIAERLSPQNIYDMWEGFLYRISGIQKREESGVL